VEKEFVHVPPRILIPIAAISQFLARRLGTKPFLEVPTLHYLSCHRVWDNSKLKATGFEFRYPTMANGMRGTLRWYRENGWLRV
jgi:hypothetical protein